MFLINSRSHLFSATSGLTRSKSLTEGIPSSGSVTVSICRVPLPEFSAFRILSVTVAPGLRYGSIQTELSGFSWEGGIGCLRCP